MEHEASAIETFRIKMPSEGKKNKSQVSKAPKDAPKSCSGRGAARGAKGKTSSRGETSKAKKAKKQPTMQQDSDSLVEDSPVEDSLESARSRPRKQLTPTKVSPRNSPRAAKNRAGRNLDVEEQHEDSNDDCLIPPTSPSSSQAPTRREGSPSSSRSAQRVARLRVEFTEEVERKMCDFIESFPVIWQSSNKDHANTDKRNQAWKLAEEQFGEPGE